MLGRAHAGAGALKAYLILENGRVFKGAAFGHLKEAVGEAVFCTSMTGYQEVLTDPSYAGQIVLMTYPLIGNTGINLEDMESGAVHLRALCVREKCDRPNNWRCEMALDGFLKQHKIMGIEGIDTRSVMRVLREEGQKPLKALVTIRNPLSEAGGVAELTNSQVRQKFEALTNRQIVRAVTCAQPYTLEGAGKNKRVAVLDLGVRAGQLREWTARGCAVTVYPAFTPAETIMAERPDGVFVSGGPGSPFDIPEIVETVKTLAMTEGLPVLGVGLGYLAVALALGATVTRMRFGRHGTNYPVKDKKTGKIYMTAQNNDYAVTLLPPDTAQTFTNLNDGTAEGLRHRDLPVRGVAFSPETAAHPCHTGFVFDEFCALLEEVHRNAQK